MKILLTITAAWVVFFADAQVDAKAPKNANRILIIGVNFRQIAEGLLDMGYSFDKIDSNFQTIKTEFKIGEGDQNRWLKLRLYVRVKDSVAMVTGEWYDKINLEKKAATIEQGLERIENNSFDSKRCFAEMNQFALSFKKPVEYQIK